MSELKRCPLCGAELDIQRQEKYGVVRYFGYCTGCGNIETPYCESRARILEILNTRPLEDELQKRIEKLNDNLNNAHMSATQYMAESAANQDGLNILRQSLKEAVGIMREYSKNPLTIGSEPLSIGLIEDILKDYGLVQDD